MRGGRSKNWGVLSGGQCDAIILARHAEGWSDAEIAKLLGVTRGAVSHHRRRRLRLPTNTLHPRRRQRVAKRTRQQLAAAGLRRLGDYHMIARRRANIDRGWPAEITPREVQILELLKRSESLTRQQICAGIGVPWPDHSRKALQCNSLPGGGYLAHLQRLGLIVRRPQWRGGKGQRHYVYSLARGVGRRVARAGSSTPGGDISQETMRPAAMPA